MNKAMMVIFVVAVTVIFGCNASTQSNNKGYAVKWTSVENPNNDVNGVSREPTEEATAPAGKSENVNGLPVECKGQMPAATTLSENLSVCRCQDGDKVAVWGVHKWQAHYPKCNKPNPDQVMRYNKNSTNADKSKAEVVASLTQVNCETRTIDDNRAIICSVTKNNQPEQTFQCVGQNIQPLTDAEKRAYSGGPPCTCAGGQQLTKLSHPENTWMCNQK